MIDLGTSAASMAGLLAAVTDDQLSAPTPCAGLALGDLVSHVASFTMVFGAIARKEAPVPPGPPDGSTLGPGWREQVAADLDALALAWRDPSSVEGRAAAGGVELPTADLLLVALDELVVHGWDVAVSSGQHYQPDPEDVRTAFEWVSGFVVPRDGGGPFGPEVPVAPDAPLLHRLLGKAGRDPGWSPSGSAGT